MQNQLNHLVVAKDFEIKQEFNSKFLVENLKDLAATNDYLKRKIDVFEDNNNVLSDANRNLCEQLGKYQKLTDHMQVEISLAEKRLNGIRCHTNSLETQLVREEGALREARSQESSILENLRHQRTQKILLDTKIEESRREVRQGEKELETLYSITASIDERNRQLNENRRNMVDDVTYFESKLAELRSQNEFLKSEVEELGQSVAQKELKNSNLSKQRQHLEALSEDFNRLRISYTEKLNDHVLARNVVIKRIMEDNNRLDALSHDADRTLKTIKNLF